MWICSFWTSSYGRKTNGSKVTFRWCVVALDGVNGLDWTRSQAAEDRVFFLRASWAAGGWLGAQKSSADEKGGGGNKSLSWRLLVVQSISEACLTRKRTIFLVAAQQLCLL